jgi:hypothetical protein
MTIRRGHISIGIETEGKWTPPGGEHRHPCEVCGRPVWCQDDCDDEEQTVVYCDRCEELEYKP